MTDILINDDYELQIQNGDLVLDVSDDQNQQLIIRAEKGNFLQYPTIGVGIEKYLNSNLQVQLPRIKREIEVNFALDGYVLLSLNLDENSIDFTAKAK